MDMIEILRILSDIWTFTKISSDNSVEILSKLDVIVLYLNQIRIILFLIFVIYLMSKILKYVSSLINIFF